MRHLPILLSLALLLPACGLEILSIEVMPPRVMGYCDSPAANSNAYGRGLLDLDATENFNGAYAADLRLTSRADVLVDGVKIDFKLPEQASSDTEQDAVNAAGEQPVGDLLLVGQDDDVRTGLVENVVLLPRNLATSLRSDDGLDTSDIVYETVVVEMEAVSEGEVVAGCPFTYAIDVCEGCLVAQPVSGTCEHGIEMNPVCRPGQEDVLWTCAAAPASSLFP